MTVGYSSFTQIPILMISSDDQLQFIYTDRHLYDDKRQSVIIYLHRYPFLQYQTLVRYIRVQLETIKFLRYPTTISLLKA